MVINLLPGASALTLTTSGFSRKLFYRSMRERPWDDYAEFGVAPQFKGTWLSYYPWNILLKMVMWNYAESYKSRIIKRIANTKAGIRWEKAIAKTKARTGYDSGFADNYGMSADKLAALMNEIRVEHLTKQLQQQ